MSPWVVIAVAVTGGIGAALRYLVDIGVTRLAGSRFPWGVFVVNVTGAFAMGVVTSLLPDAVAVLGIGLLGGYTTFSTAMLDAVALWREGARGAALFHAAGMLIAGVAAAAGGLALGTTF